MQSQRCVVCGRTLVPAEEGAPANAYVLAHERCVRRYTVTDAVGTSGCRATVSTERLDTDDRVPSPGSAPMRWP